jgi:AraC family transcriptional regulator of arabinose operon
MGHVRYPGGSRNSGTIREWVFGLILGGTVRYAHPEGAIEATAGDAVLLRPGTPQSWSVPEGNAEWECIYCILIPHPHMLPWLQYPEIRPGYAVLRLSNPAHCRRVTRAMKKAHYLATRTPFPDRPALAMAAIEEAILWCREDHRASALSLDPRVERTLAYMTRHAGNPGLSLPQLVRESGMSRPRFMDVFRKQVGMPPMTYLAQERLRRARQLLDTGLWQVKAAAAESGYADPKYFARRYRAVYGHAPSSLIRNRFSVGTGTHPSRPT